MTSRTLIATALFSVLATAPAMASFTLIAPEPTAPGDTAITAMPVAPTAPVQQSALPPQNMIAPAPQTFTAPAPQTLAAPAPKTMMAPAPMMAAPAAMTSPAFEAPVRGFGKDIPLVIAAQQIAPEGRQIAFAQGVDPSMPISWNGGKSWRNVLSDALSTSGLQVAEQGNILFISRTSSDLRSNASLMTQPKSEWSSNSTAMPVQQQPAYLPPTAPAPVMGNGMVPVPPAATAQPNTIALPPMVMPPAEPVAMQPMATQPVMPPANTMMAAPAPQPIVTAPAPRAMIANESVIPPQQPLGYQQPAGMQSTIVTVPVAPPPIPVLPSAPSITSATAPVMPLSDSGAITSGNWHATSGRTLKQTLEEWSGRANVTLRWDSEFDYPVQSNVNIDGDYEAAVRTLLRGFSSAQPQPIARLYRPDQGAPGVLLVTTRGNDMSTSQ